MRIYVEHWGDDVAKLTIFRYWGDDLAKLIIFRYWKGCKVTIQNWSYVLCSSIANRPMDEQTVSLFAWHDPTYSRLIINDIITTITNHWCRYLFCLFLLNDGFCSTIRFRNTNKGITSYRFSPSLLLCITVIHTLSLNFSITKSRNFPKLSQQCTNKN